MQIDLIMVTKYYFSKTILSSSCMDLQPAEISIDFNKTSKSSLGIIPVSLMFLIFSNANSMLLP